MLDSRTIAHLIQTAVDTSPDSKMTFVQGLSKKTYTYKEFYEIAIQLAVGFDASPGQPVLIQARSHEDILKMLWAAFLNGLVPVVLPQLDATVDGLKVVAVKQVWEELGRPSILVDTEHKDTARLLFGRQATVIQPQRDVDHELPDLSDLDDSDLAMMVMSSGSTGRSKIIGLSHSSLNASFKAVNDQRQHLREDVVLGWLAFDHIGMLSDWHLRPLSLGNDLVYLPTEQVVTNPLRILDVVAERQVSHFWAPNFAFVRLNEALKSSEERVWDLQSVKMIFNTGEAIDYESCQQLARSLRPFGIKPEAFYYGYGMTEMSGALTLHRCHFSDNLDFNELEVNGRMQPCANVGVTIAGADLRIWTNDGEAQPGQVGRVMVRGSILGLGYIDGGILENFRDEQGWFSTGDLGALVDGNLFIAGREKGVLIVNGVKYDQVEVERVVDELPQLASGYSSVVSFRDPSLGRESLGVIASPEDETLIGAEAAESAIVNVLAMKAGINAARIVLLKREDIPRTSVGKLDRRVLAIGIEEGRLRSYWNVRKVESIEMSQSELEHLLVVLFQRIFPDAAIGRNSNFFALGGNSLAALELVGTVSELFAIQVEAGDLLENATISGFAGFLQETYTGANWEQKAKSLSQQIEALGI